MRILIAEDERDLNQIITERLKKEHYSVDSCFDGKRRRSTILPQRLMM